MLRFLGVFLAFIVSYHLFTTILWYGILNWPHLQQLLALKDIIRWLAIIFFITSHYSKLKSYFITRKKSRIIFGILIIYSIFISFLAGKTGYSMLVGLKYNFHFTAVFLSSTLLGHFLFFKHNTKKHRKNIILYSQYFLIFTVFIGIILQWLKIAYPERFQFLWFWPVGDFVFWQNPPVYYRTGPWGTPRRQGLFSGPNNYWYFLVALLPTIFLRRKTKYQSRKELFLLSPKKLLNLFFLVLRFSAIIMTFSRSALLGTTITLAGIYRHKILSHKKTSIAISIITVIGFTALSIRKRGSTQEHITKKLSGIQSVIDQPLWYGLGTAWPAIHHGGTILPENYYLQVATDIGTLGFIIRTLLIFQYLQIAKRIQSNAQKHDEITQNIFLHWKYLHIGWTTLLVLGLFLHVFEDSMVNYLFFVPLGILSGYLTAYTPQKQKK